jgi:hypothetical protein
MSKKKKILNRHDFRRAIQANKAHELKNAYIEAARKSFEKMWSNTLKELDSTQRNEIMGMFERYAQDMADQAEKGLVAARMGFKEAGYVPPSKQ